jgi:hypothetical protein
MSAYTRDGKFLHDVDGRVVGFVDQLGREQLLPVGSPQQQIAGGVGAVGMTPDGILIDAAGQPLTSRALAGRAVGKGAGIWLPGTSRDGKTPLTDRNSSITFSNNGATPVIVRDWSATTWNTGTNVITDTRALVAGTQVWFSNAPSGAGTLASTIVGGTRYFVINPSGLTYQIAATPGGAAIALTAAAGTIYRNSDPDPTLPAFQFTGSGYLQSSITQQFALQQLINRYDTLATDGSDGILVAFELWHGLNNPGQDSTIYEWGRKASSNGGSGWALSLAQSAGTCYVQHVHTAKLGSVKTYYIDNGVRLQGDSFAAAGGGINTRSAVAVWISRLATPNADLNNAGVGGGLFYVEIAKRGLVDRGMYGQKDFSICTPPINPNGGSGPASYCDTGMTIGFQPNSGPAAGAQAMLAGQGIENFMIQRRAFEPGLTKLVVEQMAANRFLFPTGTPLQPACIAI